MTLAELADASDLPARTIRFYIARGLVPGPVKGGRGATYTAEHLKTLERIKRLQSEGRTLTEIGALVTGQSQAPAAVPATPWWQHSVADDVMVWVRGDASPWRAHQVRRAVEEFTRRVQARNGEGEE